MASVEAETSVLVKSRKKRIPKACGSCRQSKVKCDGLRPCSRCRTLKKVCTFTERPKDPNEAKIESLEKELESLRERLGAQSNQTPSQLDAAGFVATPVSATHLHPHQVSNTIGEDHLGPVVHHDVIHTGNSLDALVHATTLDSNNGMFRSRLDSTTMQSPATSLLSSNHSHSHHSHHSASLSQGHRLSHDNLLSPNVNSNLGHNPLKRRRTQFDVGRGVGGSGVLPSTDLITAGILTPDQADAYFAAFFQGCDQFTPVFDPAIDSSAASVRARSSLLFGTICTVGCRVAAAGTADSQQRWRLLNFHNGRALNAAVTDPAAAGLETVQALLVRACYVSERSLLLAVATRMAMDLGFPEAYDVLSNSLVVGSSSSTAAADPHHAMLMRKARTWLHLLVLGHIMHVDAGDMPSFRFLGDARRCRILLESPHLTDLDLFLLPQVELNALRAKINDAITDRSGATSMINDDDLVDVVRDAKIDLEVWFHDWTRILDNHHNHRGGSGNAGDEQLPWLRPNLQVQKCWAETMALCRALRAAGVENVEAMSAAQRGLLVSARAALQRHLDIILREPRLYLRKLRFAMDFVWAKCAFCYLLLLKLSLLIPDDGEDEENNDGDGGGGGDDDDQRRRRARQDTLVAQGATLLGELTAAVGKGAGRNSTGRVYVQLLETGINKYRDVLLRERSPGGVPPPPLSTSRQTDASALSATPSSTQVPASVNADGAVAVRDASASSSSSGEFESFVPEQFVFEWDFPGLTLFSSPTTEVGWLEDLLMGTLAAGEDFFGFGWQGEGGGV